MILNHRPPLLCPNICFSNISSFSSAQELFCLGSKNSELLSVDRFSFDDVDLPMVAEMTTHVFQKNGFDKVAQHPGKQLQCWQ